MSAYKQNWINQNEVDMGMEGAKDLQSNQGNLFINFSNSILLQSLSEVRPRPTV